MWLIVGLGNPGAKYELSRHNFGFLALDALLAKHGISTKTAFGGQAARCSLYDKPCVLLKPASFMNRSGTPVQQAMAFHKINIEHMVVIHDELDLALGELRIKRGGGNGGHNGLKDITRLIGPDFIRIRLGIGRPLHKGTEADFVLSPFSDAELPIVDTMINQAIAAISAIINDGLEQAQHHCQIRLQKTA